MENLILHLKKMRDDTKDLFLEHSIIEHNRERLDIYVHDPKVDLQMIIELNKAIGILESYMKSQSPS